MRSTVLDGMGNMYLSVRNGDVKDRLFEFLSIEKVFITITVVPAMLLFLFLTLIPISWAVVAGFYEIPAFSPEWTWVGLENYRIITQHTNFWNSLERSLIFTGGSISFQLIVGTAFALALNRSYKHASLIRAIAMLPYLIPTAILGFIALWMGNSQWGIVSQILIRVGLVQEPIPWYGSENLAMMSVILTSSWKFTIFVTIIVLARLQSIPDDLYEAATMSGASFYEKFRDITFPHLKGVIFIVLLLRGIWMFNKFDIIFVLTNGGPRDATETAPIYAYRVAFEQAHLGQAAAISTLLFVMLVVVAALYFFILEPEQEVRVE